MTQDTVLSITDRGVTYTVWFDRWDAFQSDRARWHYSITGPFPDVTGDDLTTVGDPLYAPALETLLCFLSAFLESGPDGENANLFPAHLRDYLDADDVNNLRYLVMGET